MSDSVPERCKGCAHWLGRFSGEDDDRRCNRNWGHEATHGDFSGIGQDGAPYGQPKEVQKECQVPRWGFPLPPMDENGYVVGHSADKPALDNARIESGMREGSGLRRSTPIQFHTDKGTLLLHADQLNKYLMATEQDETLEELWDDREEERDQLHEEDQRTYEDMYGVSQEVFDGAKQLPAWERGQEKIPTGIPQFDLALNGGITPGVRMNISGRPDAGKTTLKNMLEGATLRYYLENSPRPGAEKIARIVPEGFVLPYMLRSMNVDGFARDVMGYAGSAAPAEQLDPNSNEMLQGAYEVFDKHVRTLDTTFQEESFQSIISQVNEDVERLSGHRQPGMFSYELPSFYRMFSIDSIDADELAEEHFKSPKDKTESKMGEEHRVATQARLLAEGFRKLYKASKVPVSLILISQQRAEGIGTGFASKSETRGNAHPYFIDLGISLWANKYKPNKDDFKHVHAVFKKLHVDCNITPGEEVELYLKPHEGFVPVLNAIKFALERDDVDILSRSGSWVYYGKGTDEEMNRQGTNPQDIADWLREAGVFEGLYPKIMRDLGIDLSNNDEEPETDDE
jgi:RecA/RadA recombinase